MGTWVQHSLEFLCFSAAIFCCKDHRCWVDFKISWWTCYLNWETTKKKLSYESVYLLLLSRDSESQQCYGACSPAAESEGSERETAQFWVLWSATSLHTVPLMHTHKALSSGLQTAKFLIFVRSEWSCFLYNTHTQIHTHFTYHVDFLHLILYLRSSVTKFVKSVTAQS